MPRIVADYRTAVTRCAVLQAAGLALASRLTSIASALFDWLTFEWLTRMMTGRDLRFACPPPPNTIINEGGLSP